MRYRSHRHHRGARGDVPRREGNQTLVEGRGAPLVPQELTHLGEHARRRQPHVVARQVREVLGGQPFELVPGGLQVAQLGVQQGQAAAPDRHRRGVLDGGTRAGQHLLRPALLDPDLGELDAEGDHGVGFLRVAAMLQRLGGKAAASSSRPAAWASMARMKVATHR
jgi:hypothetical protein